MKTRTVTARIIGPILHQVTGGVLWKLRLKAARFPFYIDSEMCFTTKAQADAEAAKWKKRKVVITISDEQEA